MTSKKAPNKGARARKLLRKWMETEGKNQNEVSYLVDRTPEHISRILAARFTPGLETAVKFERLCGIPCHAWTE